MNKTRRDFIKKLLGIGAVVTATTGATLALASETKDTLNEVPLFICGNCKKWDEAKKVTVFKSGATGRAHARVYDETDGHYDGKTQRLLRNIQDYVQEDREANKSEVVVTWKTKSRIPRNFAHPGNCSLLKNQCVYSDDPACEVFDIRDGDLITWKKDE